MFRKAAILDDHHGIFAAVGAALLTIFVVEGYTQHAAVVGRLMPQGGIAKVSILFK